MKGDKEEGDDRGDDFDEEGFKQPCVYFPAAAKVVVVNGDNATINL